MGPLYGIRHPFAERETQVAREGAARADRVFLPGKSGHTLYIAASTSIYATDVNTRGVEL
jgi:hypothetical protein